MRILCLIDSLESGGAQRQLIGLARFLKEYKYEIKLVWYHQDNFYQNYLERYQIEYENFLLSGKWKKFFGLHSVVKKFSPDVVIAYLDGPALVSCLLRLKKSKFRLIVSERNTTQNIDWRTRIKFFLYRNADAIVPNSFAQTTFIRKNFPFLTDKLFTITNFVDTDYFSPLLEPLKYSPLLHILVVGRISPQKNVLAFLKAVKLVKNRGCKISIDWYGKVLDLNYNQECLNLRSRLEIENCITFHEEEKNILNIYRQADAFCLPSIFEGFPNVICEAMACGLPILCSDVCDNGKIVNNGINGFLFNPYSVEDMAKALIHFIKISSVERKNIGLENRKAAIKKFSKQAFVKKYIEIIQMFSFGNNTGYIK